MSTRPNPAAALALRVFENRYLLVLGLVIILLGGYSALASLPRIEDPRITNRYPRVVTFLPGASAERVESLVTDPIEDELRELSEIKEIRSTSRAGVSILQIELQDAIGPGENLQVFSKIRDRLDDVAAALPAGASAPDFNDRNGAVAFSLVASVARDGAGGVPLAVMNRLAGELADRLRAVPGTDHVRLLGAPQEEVTVTLDGAELSSLGLTAASVAEAIAGADTRMPAGTLRSGERDLLIEVDGELGSVDRVRRVPLVAAPGGRVVTVGDVAEVRKDYRRPAFDMALSDGRRGILVAAQTGRDVRVDRWASAARASVDAFAREQAGGFEVDVVFDQSVYTGDRLATLGGNLLAGAGLVMLVVLAGMGWRAALVVGSALPLSASITLFGLSASGQQLHQMSIFGMIIAIGLLIDNAIVMTDEVKKKLDAGLGRGAAVGEALSHLFVPLLASTLTTILGFMPVFLLPGAMGDFVGPIAIAVVLALSASFFVSVTIIPALAGLALRRHAPGSARRWWSDGCSSTRLAGAWRRFVEAAVRRPAVTAAACAALPVAGFVLAGTLGQQFFPPADRDQFEIEAWLPPGTAISTTAALARDIEATLRSDDEVEAVHWLVGGSYPTIYYNRIMREEGNPAYAHAMVYTRSVRGARALTTRLPAELGDAFPGARIVVSPFAQGPPVEAPVGFRIEGPATAELRRLGEELRAIMHRVPDIVQTRASITGGQPRLDIAADEIAARQAGLSLGTLAGQLQAGLEGRVGGAVLEDVEELPVRVRLDGDERDSTTAVASLPLVADPSSGRWLPVDGLGSIGLVPATGSISRVDGVRSNNVLGYIRRDALAIDVTGAVLEEADRQGYTLPPGYRLVVAGDSAEQSEALGKLTTYLPVLATLMIATVVLSFRSVRLATLIGVVALLSVGLGMLSLWAGGYARGFNAIIGSVGLVGVAINGTIVVLAAIRANADARRGDPAAIAAETVGATRHIVSTTLTTVGGFVPLLVFTGGEFWPPLAIVIAGGVLLSVTLSLLFTPAAYRWMSRLRVPVRGPEPLPRPAVGASP